MANPKLWTGVGSPQSIYESSTVQSHPIGSRGGLDDGRVFYYTKNAGTALDPGKVVMAEVTTAEFANQAVAAAAAAGTNSVSVTTGATAVTLNEYADGYLTINDAAGEGHSYKVAGHAAAGGAATCVLSLYDNIVVALTTSSQYTLTKNLWADVVIAAAGHVHVAVGVPQAAIGASEYGWLQTWGVSAVWDDASTAIGGSLQSGATEGQIEVGDGAAQNLGVQIYTGVATEYYPHFLTIAP